ncbi:MAG: hypothetical protein Q9202_007569 [Teloschistes flavicans]
MSTSTIFESPPPQGSEFLPEYEVDDKVYYYRNHIEDQTSDGKTALFLAVENGHFATTEVLMAHEAQIFTKCKEGNTPIHAIASAEDFVWSKKTLEKILCGDGAARCFEHKNQRGQTPTALSLTHHNFECFRLLKSKGASLNVIDDRGENLLNRLARTPFHSQLDFNHLGNEERWILRDNQAGYWDHLTSRSYAVYEVVYDRCKPVHKSVRYRNFANHLENCGLDEKFVRRTWKRLLRTPNSDLENSTYPRPLVLATLYMLHLEHCAGIKIHEVSDERFNLFTRFDLWIKCHCSQQCKIEWNFANKSGMYRPPRARKTSCKAVQAKENFSIIPSRAKKTRLNNLFHRKNDEKILDDLYKAWKQHN